MVTAALGSILLSVVGMVALFAEKSANTAGSEFGAARRAGTVLTSAISSLGSAVPAHGCALFADGKAGQQVSFSPPTFSWPVSQCAQTAVFPQADLFSAGVTPPPAPLLALATAPGKAQGLCWLAATSQAVGVVAPDLHCLVAYPDGTIWSFDWPPARSATSTSYPPTTAALDVVPTADGSTATLCYPATQGCDGCDNGLLCSDIAPSSLVPLV